MGEWRVTSDADVADLAERLRSLKWSWQVVDFPPLAEAFGWRIEMSNPSWVRFDSGLGMSSGKVLGRDGVVGEIEVMLTDFADQDNSGRDRIRDTFARYTAVVTEALGEPTSRLPGDIPEVRWGGTDTTVYLTALPTRVSLNLATNMSIELQDMAAEAQDGDDLDSDIWGSAQGDRATCPD